MAETSKEGKLLYRQQEEWKKDILLQVEWGIVSIIRQRPGEDDVIATFPLTDITIEGPLVEGSMVSFELVTPDKSYEFADPSSKPIQEWIKWLSEAKVREAQPLPPMQAPEPEVVPEPPQPAPVKPVEVEQVKKIDMAALAASQGSPEHKASKSLSARLGLSPRKKDANKLKESDNKTPPPKSSDGKDQGKDKTPRKEEKDKTPRKAKDASPRKGEDKEAVISNFLQRADTVTGGQSPRSEPKKEEPKKEEPKKEERKEATRTSSKKDDDRKEEPKKEERKEAKRTSSKKDDDRKEVKREKEDPKKDEPKKAETPRSGKETPRSATHKAANLKASNKTKSEPKKVIDESKTANDAGERQKVDYDSISED